MSKESVAHLSVAQLRTKCKDIGAAVRGNKLELLLRLQALGYGTEIKQELKQDPEEGQEEKCPTCHQIPSRVSRKATEKPRSRGLKKSELLRSVIKDGSLKRRRIRPERFEPDVARAEIEDDGDSDWEGISVDDDFSPYHISNTSDADTDVSDVVVSVEPL